MLEANCNCGLSTDGETSVSWILRLSGETMPRLLDRIFTDAVARRVVVSRRPARRRAARVEAVAS